MNNCNCEKHEKIRDMLLNSAEYLVDVEKVSNIFALLGEGSRMKILLALFEGELCVSHICEITGNKQSVTSQHLRKLKDSHIIKSRKLGNQVLYSLKDEHVASIIKLALEHKDC
jgi:ArsR family transcriptional regulator